MIKILLFAGFIIAYLLYIFSTYKLMSRFLNTSKKSYFIENELLIIIPSFFFFCFIFFVGNFINIKFALLYIIASNLGLIFVSIFWNLMGNPRTPYKEIGGWIGAELGENNAFITIAISILSILSIVVFPIIMGINHFSAESIDVNQIIAIKYSIYFILFSFIMSLPMVIGVLTSSYVDEDTRARYFLNQFSGIISNALFLSLLFWIISPNSNNDTIEMGDLSFNYSPNLFIILTVFSVLFLILPYIIGIQKGKRIRAEFLESKTDLINKVIEVFNLARGNVLTTKVKAVMDNIKQEYIKLLDSHSSIAKAEEYEEIQDYHELNDSEILRYRYYTIVKTYDFRIKYCDFLKETYEKLGDLNFNLLNNTPDDKEIDEMRKGYLDHFKSLKKDMGQEVIQLNKRQPIIYTIFLMVLFPIFNQILSELGKYLSSFFNT